MNLNQYVTLGRSGLRVSRLCLGTMTFGNQWGWGSNDDTSRAIMDKYLGAGGNFIDSANIYTKGYSEKFIGDYFFSKKGTLTNLPRDRVVIATKFMGNMYLGDPNGGGAGRKSIIAACEQSLRRLRTDYIDLYWAHFWDHLTPLDEMLRAMESLVQAGKVRYLGLSDHPAWVCAHAHHIMREINGSRLIALQIEYSLLQRTVEAELLPMARHFEMGVTPWSPLRGGVLSGKFARGVRPSTATRVQDDNPHLNEKTYQIVDEMTAVATRVRGRGQKETSVAQVALRWLLQKAGVGSVIIGARTVAQFEDNVGCLDFELLPDEMSQLDMVSQVPLAFPHDFVEMTKANILGGTRVNGQSRPVWDLAPKGDEERY